MNGYFKKKPTLFRFVVVDIEDKNSSFTIFHTSVPSPLIDSFADLIPSPIGDSSKNTIPVNRLIDDLAMAAQIYFA